MALSSGLVNAGAINEKDGSALLRSKVGLTLLRSKLDLTLCEEKSKPFPLLALGVPVEGDKRPLVFPLLVLVVLLEEEEGSPVFVPLELMVLSEEDAEGLRGPLLDSFVCLGCSALVSPTFMAIDERPEPIV